MAGKDIFDFRFPIADLKNSTLGKRKSAIGNGQSAILNKEGVIKNT